MASLTTLINRMTYWCVTANMGYSQYDRWNFNSPEATATARLWSSTACGRRALIPVGDLHR